MTLPSIEGYPAPAQRVYNSQKILNARYLDYNYYNVSERVNVHALIVSDKSEISILNGQVLTAKITNSETVYTTTFDNEGNAVLNIPYGLEYTLVYPKITGLIIDVYGRKYTAGVISREIVVQYSDNMIGVFGISSEGRHYTISTIKEGLKDGSIKETDIVAVGVATAELVRAKRGDGVNSNCSFCFNIEDTAVKMQWSNANVAFNPNKLPYISSLGAISSQIDGNYNTAKIIEVSNNSECGTWKLNSETGLYEGSGLYSASCPAATYCYGKSLTINGVKRNGFLPSFYQIYVAKNNLSSIRELYTLLGKTSPSITAGDWWTSCQYSETGSVGLNNGSFFGYGNKTYSISVLPVYDL